MGTRCEIIIKNSWKYEDKRYKNSAKLYHHFDGYPSGVGQFLMENVYPKLMRNFSESCDSIANFLIKNEEDTGYEATYLTHSDIDYVYIIDIPSKTIKCLEGYYYKGKRGILFHKVKEHDLSCYIKGRLPIGYA